MLLVTSILSALIAGFFGYRNGSEALRQAAVDKVVAVNDARAREVRSLMRGLERSLILNSLNLETQRAMASFSRDFQALDREEPTDAQRADVERYYEEVFAPQLEENVSGTIEPAAYVPTGNAQVRLQAAYTAPYADFDEAIAVDDAGDGTAWSRDHAQYHNFLREVVERNGFEDAMLIDTRGNIVYTAYKGIDLGGNLDQDFYRNSLLSSAYDEVLRTNATASFVVTDFEPYVPSADVPTAFGLSPIGQDGELVGVLAVQLPVEAINGVTTAGGDWEQAGLGKTGETFLVGDDSLMRSTSRELLEDPERFRADVVSQGTDPAAADDMVRLQSPILRQAFNTVGVGDALRGQSGTVEKTSYLGHDVIAAYRPAELPGLNWAVVTQVDTEEALAPVRDFLRALALTLLGLVLATVLASMWLARSFSQPLTTLLSGVRKVSGGDLDARVSLRNRDEFGSLANAFNEMAASLRNKQDLLDEQRAENERMLHSIMPPAMAERYHEGGDNVADQHSDVSVIFANVEGFDRFTREKSAEDSVALLNELYRRFEQAGDEAGVERVRTLRSGFVACSGLNVPRVDHATRVVSYAQELLLMVERFNAQYDAGLRLRAGIDCGSVTSGLIGSASVYDLWGESVNLAYTAQSSAEESGVYLTKNVYDRVSDAFAMTPAGTVVQGGVSVPVWRMDERG